jgi:vitamin B12 transporter
MKQFFFTSLLGLSALIFKGQNISDSTLTITANKFAQSNKQTAKQIQVITAKDIKLYAATNLSQLLNNAAGFYVAGANSAFGSVQSVFNRGAAASNTLILLNGMPLQDASGISQQFDINQIDINNVERIEICKQAQSSLYGSDAVAGVVNIITKSGKKKPFNANVNVAGGSFNTKTLAANINGQDDNVSYLLGFSNIKSNGISSALDTTNNNNFDNDFYKQYNLNAALTITDEKIGSITFNGLFSQYKAGLDNAAFKDEKDYTLNNLTANAGINAIFNINSKNKLHFNLNGNFSDRSFFNDSKDVVGFNTLERSNYQSKVNFKELYLHSQLNKNTNLIIGVDYRKYTTEQFYFSQSSFGIYSTDLGDSANVKQGSLYGNITYNNKNFGLDAGLRYTNYNLFGSNLTYSLNPYYTYNSFKVFASINSAFRAPSQYQLFANPYNNKNLKAESSLNTEIGVNYSHKNFNVSASFFSRNIKDAIQFVRLDTSFFFDFKYLNFDKQNDYGVELIANAQINKHFSLSANYTYVQGQVSTKLRQGVSNNNQFGKDSSFNNLYRRPNSMGNIMLNYATNNGLRLALQSQFVGSRLEPRFNASALTLKKYTLLNFLFECTINKYASMHGQINNILDANFQESRGYSTIGRNLIFGFKFKL